MTGVTSVQLRATYLRTAPLLSLLMIVLTTTAIMLAVRLYLIEPEPMALACAANNSGWRCMVREIAVAGFLHNVFGLTALITGVIVTVVRWRPLALIAIVSGVAGAVLYTFEFSGAGLLLGALTWVHGVRPAPTQDDGKQEA
jgi:hypothetical protein